MHDKTQRSQGNYEAYDQTTFAVIRIKGSKVFKQSPVSVSRNWSSKIEAAKGLQPTRLLDIHP